MGESEELKQSIMSFQYTEDGYQGALNSLQMRFGDEQAFKLAIYAEIDELKGKIDLRSGKGMWDLYTLMASILCNPLFNDEKHRNSMLYTKFITIFPKHLIREYNLRYPTLQDLKTLANWIGELAKQHQEHDFYTSAHPNRPKDKPNKSGYGNPNAQKKQNYSSNTKPAGSRENTKNDKDQKTEKPNQKKDPKCYLCKQKHYTDKCHKLKGSVADKKKVILAAKLCTNCLFPL